MPDNGDSLARFNDKADVPQHPVWFQQWLRGVGSSIFRRPCPLPILAITGVDRNVPIRKPDMIKFNAARTFWLLRDCGRSDLHRRIQQLKNTLAGSHGRLQDVVFLAEVLNGPEESLRVLDECRQNSDGSGAANYVVATKPDDTRNGDRGKDFDHGVVDGMGHNGVFEGVHVAGVDVGKLCECPLLTIKELQDHHSADMLLQIRIDAGYRNTNAAVGITNFVTKDFGRDCNQGQNGEGDECELRIHVQHDGHNAG